MEELELSGIDGSILDGSSLDISSQVEVASETDQNNNVIVTSTPQKLATPEKVDRQFL